MIDIIDTNGDGIARWSEIHRQPDMVVLAARMLAAAQWTADGLLTIANALSHDLFYRTVDPEASSQRRGTISKILLGVFGVPAGFAAAIVVSLLDRPPDAAGC